MAEGQGNGSVFMAVDDDKQISRAECSIEGNYSVDDCNTISESSINLDIEESDGSGDIDSGGDNCSDSSGSSSGRDGYCGCGAGGGSYGGGEGGCCGGGGECDVADGGDWGGGGYCGGEGAGEIGGNGSGEEAGDEAGDSKQDGGTGDDLDEGIGGNYVTILQNNKRKNLVNASKPVA